MQNLSPDNILAALALGVVVLCFSLLQIFRRSIRDPKRRVAGEQDRVREIMVATRSSLLELQSILASEVPAPGRGEEFVISHAPALVRLGRGEVELLQKVSKYRLAAVGTQAGDAVKIH